MIKFQAILKCLLCKQSIAQTQKLHHTQICQYCVRAMPALSFACPRCAEPMAQENRQEICGRCLRFQPPQESCVAPFLYQHPIDTMIKRFKRKHQFEYGDALTHLFLQSPQMKEADLPSFIVPVPTHWKKTMYRGFNQSLFLAEKFAKALGCKVLDIGKMRTSTTGQKQLSRTKRIKNRDSSFGVNGHLRGEHVAIVDDVFTTGATTIALAKRLKKAGAGRIDIWVVARTPAK